MPTLNSILNTARSAITTSQAAIQVTSNNIANANTEGYSRQRAIISSTHPLHTPFGSFGTGVEITGVVRHRDALLDGQFRRANAQSNYHGMQEQLLSRIEATLAEPTDAGLMTGIDRFFAAYSDVANDPTSNSARSALREQARALASRFNAIDQGVQAVRNDVVRDLQGVVAEVNTLASRIADLNQQIVTAESNGQQAPNLRDTRDQLVDQLSRHADLQVIERPGGELGVFAGGVPIVDGQIARSIEVRQSGTAVQIGLVGTTTVINRPGGALGARVDIVNNDVPATLSRLDALANAFVTEVNLLHQTGTNPLGQTAIDFFDPTGTAASSIGLSADVLADSQAIAAGTPDLLGAYQAGANDVALSIAGLRTTVNGTLGTTFSTFHNETATQAGLAVANARDSALTHDTLTSRADSRRQSVSGVLTDEEVISLIEFQQAYTAATRLVSVADEMMQTILQMV